MAKRLNKETVNGEEFRFKKWDNNGRQWTVAYNKDGEPVASAPTKEEVMEHLKSLTADDPYQLGYERGYKTAAGEEGTGYMAYDSLQRDEILEEHGRSPSREDVLDYARGWTETVQWGFETNDILPSGTAQLGRPTPPDERPDFDRFAETESGWTAGWADYVVETEGWGD